MSEETREAWITITLVAVATLLIFFLDIPW
jgi:hypothetical protein